MKQATNSLLFKIKKQTNDQVTELDHKNQKE